MFTLTVYTMVMEFIQSQHSVYRLSYHIVWVCKYRRRVLKPGVVEYMKLIMPKLLKSIPGVEVEKIGFDQDHVHFVMTIPPKYAISDVIAQLKSQSSSLIRAKFNWLSKVYFKENVLWSRGYFVSSVGLDEERIKNYVQYQGRLDSGQLRLKL